VRREIWEHPAIYVGPLIAAGVVLFGYAISATQLPHNRRAALALDPARQAFAIALPFHLGAMAILITMVLVGGFYCLGALHNERRDRSILFWKSLPVSDVDTVLAKFLIPLVILPGVALTLVLSTQLVMLLLNTIVLALSGMDPWLTWARLPVVGEPVVLFYALAVISLWYAPLWAWLLLVSGWAKRAPFLWAVLPPLALCLVEKIAFNSTHVLSLLADRLGGFKAAFSAPMHGQVPDSPLPIPDIVAFLTLPGLWLGLLIACGLVAATIWQRRYREPI
jgi:ABC-2 type transport system permease protein